MGFFSFDQVHELWNIWEVRGIILFSLFLQSFLILVSPFRTKTANSVISVLLWLAYLLADAAATFAVGLISHSQGESSSADKTKGELLAFWAPILIIHLGGPDTITALALEDNELWKRHLLQLLSQLAATLYILYKSLTRDSELLAPTILVLVVGIFKYGERVYSLYLASLDKFRDSLLTDPGPGPSYAKFLEEYVMSMDAGLRAEIEHIRIDAAVPIDEYRSDIEIVQDAYKWFTKFKGLVADFVYSKADWQKTRDYFSKRDAEQAFRIMEIELNFIYEFLYTKMPVIRTWVGFIFRIVCFVLVLVSFFLWHSIHKSHIPPNDVKITYALLGGAITLDVIAFFMLIFSDWSIANVIKGTFGPDDESQQNKKGTIRNKLKRLINGYLAISDRRYWSGYSEKDRTVPRKLLLQVCCFWRSNSAAQGDEGTLPLLVLASRIFHRRWSESVQQFNLIDYCVNARSEPVEKVCGWVGLTDFLDRVQYVSIRWFSESLRDSIFSELKAKSDTVKKPGDADKICEARGEWVLENELSSFFINWKVLKPWLTDVHYDESLILWHIATGICYNNDIGRQLAEEDDDDASQQNHPASWVEENEIEQQKGPEIDQEEKEDGQKHKCTKTDPEEHEDTEKRKGLASLEKEDDVEQQLSSSEIQEYQENAARQQEGDETIEEEKGHVMQQMVHKIVEMEVDIDAKRKKGPQSSSEAIVERQQNNPAKAKVSKLKIDHEIAKTLSDYMLHLLIMQPKIMTTVAGIGRFRFRATCVQTCAEAKLFLEHLAMEKNEKNLVCIACSKLLEVNTEITPKEVKRDRITSLLFEGCRLAKELNKLGDDKWNVIHKVWVEMLCYAATHCSGHTHAAQLSKGGQLITFVWLLMVHLGLGKQFLRNEDSVKPVIGR